MCAAAAGQRGRKVLVLDHADKAGQKVLMGGGGRCNFTNLEVSSDNYLCSNPHFVKSALKRYSQWDFIDLVQRYQIRYHERDHGQLFCDDSAQDIQRMLLAECAQNRAELRLECSIKKVNKDKKGFHLITNQGDFKAQSLVVASGGLSIPAAGASSFGYRIAEQFGVAVVPTSPALVPLTWPPQEKQLFAELSGMAISVRVRMEGIEFSENLLFTHRGLSGPVILQISNYWQPGTPLEINLLPDMNLFECLTTADKAVGARQLKTVLAGHLPKRLITALLPNTLAESRLADLSHTQLKQIADAIHSWKLTPNGSEGYRTAEVTKGGVDCDAISSKTFEARDVPGLYFIGEVLDVTGWLGGYNFQWAWSSGWCAGQVV